MRGWTLALVNSGFTRKERGGESFRAHYHLRRLSGGPQGYIYPDKEAHIYAPLTVPSPSPRRPLAIGCPDLAFAQLAALIRLQGDRLPFLPNYPGLSPL